jgi:hypothetical protein
MTQEKDTRDGYQRKEENEPRGEGAGTGGGAPDGNSDVSPKQARALLRKHGADWTKLKDEAEDLKED